MPVAPTVSGLYITRPYPSPTHAHTPQVGAFLVIPSLAALADALPAVQAAMAGLGAESAGGMLHVAVCGALHVPPFAARLLFNCGRLMRAAACVRAHFPSQPKPTTTHPANHPTAPRPPRRL